MSTDHLPPIPLACAACQYDAEIELASIRGNRRIPYAHFHTGYKRNLMAPDELLYAVHLPLRFAHRRQYLRKVGTRRAMAISKVALAASALVEEGAIREIRIAAAKPRRLPYPPLSVGSSSSRPATLARRPTQSARAALLAEAKPIDDIRSTAEYRIRVAANLLEEFLKELQVAETAA